MVTPGAFNARDEVLRREFYNGDGAQKNEFKAPPNGEKKFDDIFSRLDTILHVGRTDENDKTTTCSTY